MIDEEGNFTRMSLEEIIATGKETVRIRAMRGQFFEIRVETLIQTDPQEAARRRQAQFALNRRELREDPDYDDPATRKPPPPYIAESWPIQQTINRRNPWRGHFRHPYDNDFARPVPRRPREQPHLIPVIPEEEPRLTIPEPQLRNEEAENWRKQADDYRERLEMATEEIHDLQEMLKANQRKMVLGMIELMKLAKQKKE